MTDAQATLLKQGLALHRQGQLAAAKAIYESILASKPDHFDALNMLGAIALQTGNLEAATSLIGHAIAVEPNNATAHNNLGNALLALGRLSEAVASYDKALALKPNLADVHGNRGNALLSLKQFDEALASYDKALALGAQQAEVYGNRGNALGELRRWEEALASYDKALSVDANYLEAHNNRGSALLELDQFAAALASFDRALELNPDSAELHFNRGKALLTLGRLDHALASYDMALSLQPHYPEAYVNRGNALLGLKRLDDARASYSRAVALNPGLAEAHYNLGGVLLDQGEPAEALASFERTIALQPDFPDAYGNLIFALNFVPGETTASQQARRKAWNDTVASIVPAAAAAPSPRQGKLRIGYVSRTFRHQAATYAFAAAILYHDRERFEVFCYSDTAREDDVTAHLKAAATTWRSTAHLSDERLAEQIRADGIDILVDCVGHMKGHRLLAFARKPAPVQITGWGEPTGTGLAAMDYLLADPVLVPLAERHLLGEAVIDLPCALSFWCPEDLATPGALPAMSAGHVTFGSFNRAAKLTAPTLQLWSRVLAAVPTSRLLLKSPTWVDAEERERLLQRMEQRGVARERITILGDTSRADHFAAYRAVDICLDPLPHGGGMTTLDALWMGLPVITLRGATPSSRLAASVLTALGLTEWIAADEADYVGKAAALAADLTRLSEFRRTLRDRVRRSPVGDLPGYAKALEARYREVWDARQR